MNKPSHYRWTLTFFGLADDYREALHKEIFQLCYHTNSGFTHDEVYFMPSSKRKYYLRLLVDTRKKENEAIKKSSQGKQGVNKPPSALSKRFKKPQ